VEVFYSSGPHFQHQRDRSVNYQTSKAEELPFADSQFDLHICDNVLDHCDEVQKVFSEMRRVLRDSGIIYLRVHTYSLGGEMRSMVV